MFFNRQIVRIKNLNKYQNSKIIIIRYLVAKEQAVLFHKSG
jgi:hypothetical protein